MRENKNVKHVRKTRMFLHHKTGVGVGYSRTALDKQGFCLCNERFEKRKKKKKKVKHMGCLIIRQETSQRANKDMPSGEMKDLAMQPTAPSQFLSDW